MAKVLNGEKGIKIGVYHFSDRKRPALCVAEGNSIVVYAYFKDDENADMFMHKLAVAIGAKEE